MLLGVIDIGVGVILLLLAFGPASGRVAAGVLLGSEELSCGSPTPT